MSGLGDQRADDDADSADRAAAVAQERAEALVQHALATNHQLLARFLHARARRRPCARSRGLRA